MVSTNQKILEQAKILFNEYGYKNVSLRNIAEAAGTTIGNLTYHFPKKDDLVSTMQLELYTDFLNIDFEIEDEEYLFRNVISSFKTMDQNRDNNIFFYRNIVELSQESDKIAKNIEEFRRKLYNFYLSSFTRLKNSGIMRDDVTEKQYEALTYTLSNMTFIWRQNTTQYFDSMIPRIELGDALTSLIYPYLTNKGKDIFHSLK